MKHLRKFNENIDFDQYMKFEDRLPTILDDVDVLSEYLDKFSNNKVLRDTINVNIEKLFKLCIKGDWWGMDDIGSSYYESFVKLMEFIGDYINKKQLVKWTLEYGRIDILEYLYNNGYFNEYDDLINWVEYSRKISLKDKEETIQYLNNIKK